MRRGMTLVESLVGAAVGTVVLGLVWGLTAVQCRQAAREESLARAVAAGHLIEARLKADLRRIVIGHDSPKFETDGVSFDVRDGARTVRVSARFDAAAGEVEHRRGAAALRAGAGRVEGFAVRAEPAGVRWEIAVRTPRPRDEVVRVDGGLAIRALAARDQYAFWQEVPR